MIYTLAYSIICIIVYNANVESSVGFVLGVLGCNTLTFSSIIFNFSLLFV